MMLGIELNDTGILAVGGAGSALSPNPGYALLEGDTVLVGREAARRARLTPRRIHHRFWEQIDTAPLKRPYPNHLSTADLAHAHLGQVWRECGDGVDEALLVIPGRYSDKQLGLILGVARACDIPVSGMVDSSVAATSDRVPVGDVVFLDLQLHAAVVTVLSMEGGPVRRSVTVDDGVGTFSLIDAVARHTAELFLRTTRFDPLHRAVSEQTLYDHVPQWIRDIRRHETLTVAIDAEGGAYESELTRSGVIDSMAGLLDHIADVVDEHCVETETTVVLSHTATQFPGLVRRFCRAGAVERLPIGAAAVGALKHAPSIVAPGESLPFITRLAVDAPAQGAPTAEPPPTAGVPPTHVVHDGRAVPIDERPLVVGIDPTDGVRRLVVSGNTAGVSRSHCRFLFQNGGVVVEDKSTYGTFVNDRRIEGVASVFAGDVVRVGTPGIELQLIEVVQTDGTS